MSKEYIEPRIKVPRFKESAGYFTTMKRSEMMSKIKAKNTKPEILFRKALYNAGVRYRVHTKNLTGNPDITNQQKKFVIFIDGEFWHGYKWEERKYKLKKNRDFWIAKIERNIQRDKEVVKVLEKKGFKVFRFWENEIYKNLGTCLHEVLAYIAKLENGFIQ